MQTIKSKDLILYKRFYDNTYILIFQALAMVYKFEIFN